MTFRAVHHLNLNKERPLATQYYAIAACKTVSLLANTMERSTRMSDARIGAIAVLAFSFLMTVIAFFTPYWLASERRLYGAEFDKLGLWETCFRSLRGPNDVEYSKYYSGCRWIFFYEYKNIRGFLLPGQSSLLTVNSKTLIKISKSCRRLKKTFERFK